MSRSSLGSHTSGSVYLYSAERERERKQNWWGEGLSIAARDLKGWILPQQPQKSPVKLYKCHFYKYFKAQHDIWKDCSYFCFKFCENLLSTGSSLPDDGRSVIDGWISPTRTGKASTHYLFSTQKPEIKWLPVWQWCMSISARENPRCWSSEYKQQ